MHSKRWLSLWESQCSAEIADLSLIMSTSRYPWWIDDTSGSISSCAFTLLPLMSISCIQGQFPLLFRLLCVPKQMREPLWDPFIQKSCFLACIAQKVGRLWIYRKRVLKPLGSELRAGRLAREMPRTGFWNSCCGWWMAAQSVLIGRPTLHSSSLIQESNCSSLAKICPCRSKWTMVCCGYY